MSDFDINSICLEYPSQLGHLQLKSEVLYESPKMRKLETLLPQLIVKLFLFLFLTILLFYLFII